MTVLAQGQGVQSPSLPFTSPTGTPVKVPQQCRRRSTTTARKARRAVQVEEDAAGTARSVKRRVDRNEEILDWRKLKASPAQAACWLAMSGVLSRAESCLSRCTQCRLAPDVPWQRCAVCLPVLSLQKRVVLPIPFCVKSTCMSVFRIIC